MTDGAMTPSRDLHESDKQISHCVVCLACHLCMNSKNAFRDAACLSQSIESCIPRSSRPCLPHAADPAPRSCLVDRKGDGGVASIELRIGPFCSITSSATSLLDRYQGTCEQDSPLRPLLVQHTTSTLDAADRIALLQGEFGATVAAHVVHGRVGGHGLVEAAAAAAASSLARAAGRGGLRGGDLVGFPGHLRRCRGCVW